MTKPFHFSRHLISWYNRHARDLPWRRTSDPYKIWISEIMLQQTTVNAVIPYYKRWMKRFPKIRSVAKAPLQKILLCWQGLGYYQRAKNIHKSAKLICEQYHEEIPEDAQVLTKLPGFGPYTVGAVLSIAFDQRKPIIDANVRRIFMRLLALQGNAEPSKDPQILKYLDQVMPQKNLKTFNQALMELGALVCRNREPLCLLCPLKTVCKAYQKGIQEIIPESKQKAITDIKASVAILKRNGKYFIQKRSSKGLLADLWEFPGGVIEKGETAYEALVRELKEELGVSVNSAKQLMSVQHYYTQFRVKLYAFDCTLCNYPKSDTTHKWVTPKKLQEYPMPSGSAKIVDKLLPK